MFCPRCGAENPDNAYRCSSCGAAVDNPPAVPPQPAYEQPRIFNWLVPAIIVNLCCCAPIGLVAVIYAAQVNSKLEGGNIEGAMQAAKMAKIWFWVGLLIGVPLMILIFTVNFVSALEQFKNMPMPTGSF